MSRRCDGSSPRVRGTASRRSSNSGRNRFIPACAGEQTGSVLVVTNGSGSSPRVRGTGSFTDPLIYQSRFIPACAGNSVERMTRKKNHPVHPRVCGEQIEACPDPRHGLGSSPRVRGTAYRSRHNTFPLRFIPACAGNRIGSGSAGPAIPVHPRVCGEQTWTRPCCSRIRGSSPRVRGTGAGNRRGICRCRFIPACAGNSEQRFGGS